MKMNFIIMCGAGLAAALVLAAFLLCLPVLAEEPASAAASGRPIQDNSFLIEEAYNQERGVVQHISSFLRLWGSRDWLYTFTQEWPLPRRPRHQLSYTLAVTGPGATPGAGLGDMMLNYRYQLVGSGDTRLAFAPRISLLLPSGDSRLGRGFGGYGVQANLPLSLVLGRRWVTHWNLGATLVPNAQNAAGQRAAVTGYNAGQSVVWLAKPRFNILLETVWSGAEEVVGDRRTQRSHALFISPGLRWAHNLRSGLQIVPGIAVPIGVGPSRGERGVLLYLSFEHPLRRLYGE